MSNDTTAVLLLMSKYIILSFYIEYSIEYILREYIACESFLISIAMFSVLVSFIIGTNVVVLYCFRLIFGYTVVWLVILTTVLLDCYRPLCHYIMCLLHTNNWKSGYLYRQIQCRLLHAGRKVNNSVICFLRSFYSVSSFITYFVNWG